jgi:hypothetical protein
MSVQILAVVSLTDRPDREELLLLRQRYVELIQALRQSREYNPATLDALTEIFGATDPAADVPADNSAQPEPGADHGLSREAA